MAKLDGILKIQGTLENLTFYKSADGYKVRTRGGVSKQRIMNDPAFVRTRENGSEFGHSASAGKMLRTAVGTMAFKAKDAKVTSRLLKVMSGIKNEDLTSNRGSRSVAKGIVTGNGKLLLKGFDFNNHALMRSVLFAPLTIDTLTGKVVISNLNPSELLRFPEGATHFSLQSAFVNLDFTTGISAVNYSPIIDLPINSTDATQTLTPSGVPAGSGSKIYLLMIAFYQAVNGVQYPLKNGSYNVLNVLEVA